MNSINPLNPLDFPLSGRGLIEASAGTGKTYTITALYVRLVLGHHLDNDQRRELFPPDILVVTFTEAATKELRERIRSRLNQAARYFSQQSENGDYFLEQLRSSYPSPEWPACAHRLKLAADWMDEAAVYTIHGWCNRMLQQYAFDSGNLFRQEVNNDDQELLNEAVRDYWRTFFYPLTEIQCLAVLNLAFSPEDLANKIKLLLSETEAMGLEDNGDKLADILGSWETWEQQRRELERCAQHLWNGHRREIENCLRTALENRWLHANQYKQANINAKLKDLALWAQWGLPQKLEHIEKFGQQKLLDGLVKAHKDKSCQLQHPAFQAIDDLASHSRQEIEISKKLKLHAINWIRDRYDQAKQRAAQINYDDMLTRLDKALQSSNGERLASVIRQQYPIVLFDEFQDTDPIQYRIISTLYPKDSEAIVGCFMIGDPKQAIYSFRGADIFTYLKAHRDTAGRHYTLDTNYRSTSGLVEAVNQIFLHADQLAEGAFRFNSGHDNPLPFIAVNAKGRNDDWAVDRQLAPALTVWHWESSDPIGMPDYRGNIAEVTASEIVRLLDQANRGNTGFIPQSGNMKPVQPSDIAILVRSGTEAKAMRTALAKRKLRSVYLSERDSIYASREAHDILLWLKAIDEPRNERKVRTALATATIGWDWQILQSLTSDEPNWEQQIERFLEYQSRWQQDGILPAIRQLINDYGLPARLAGDNDGERCLTNLLHLAELLQQASGHFDGRQALIRHLAEQIMAANQKSEENVIRLESDANLIKVITIHKSKGLEYPLVFLPFICSFREIGSRHAYYRYHDANQNLCIDLDKADDNKALSDRERLQEDIRLLYVALTRAQYACWLGVAPIKNGNFRDCQLDKSAMGYLLGWQAGMPANALAGLLTRLKGDCEAIAITSPPELSQDLYLPPGQREQLDSPRISTAKIGDNWWIASYSALQSEKTYPSFSDSISLPSEPETAKDDKRNDESESPVEPSTKALSGIHSLARGAEPGTLIHELLEQCAYFGFQAVFSSSDSRNQLIDKVFAHSSWEEKRDILSTTLAEWLAMPLLETDAVRLRDLTADHFQAEMEFLLGADNVDVSALDCLVTQHTFSGKPRPRLLPAQMHGLLKGFIDLVFVHQGKYYVLDYKFNSLGNNDAAYTPETLEAAMLEKRYDLQYTLYLLAIHRLLKTRLGSEYDYDKHVGGALYLFLRGINASCGGRVFDKPPRLLIEALDTLLCGSPNTASHL